MIQQLYKQLILIQELKRFHSCPLTLIQLARVVVRQSQTLAGVESTHVEALDLSSHRATDVTTGQFAGPLLHIIEHYLTKLVRQINHFIVKEATLVKSCW